MTEGEVERLKIGDRLKLEDRTGTILAFYDSVDGPRLVAIKWDEEAKPEAGTTIAQSNSLADRAARIRAEYEAAGQAEE